MGLHLVMRGRMLLDIEIAESRLVCTVVFTVFVVLITQQYRIVTSSMYY